MGAARKRSYAVYASNLQEHHRDHAIDYQSPASTYADNRPYESVWVDSLTTGTHYSPELCPARDQGCEAVQPLSILESNTLCGPIENRDNCAARRKGQKPRGVKRSLPIIRRAASLPTSKDLQQLPLIAPLTRQNLAHFGKMDVHTNAQLITLDRSVSSSGRSYQPKNSSPSKASSVSTDAGAKMELANLMGDDVGAEALSLQPTFRNRVIQIVEADRSSAMKPESIAKFRRTLSKVRTRNETTLATRLMPYLVKDDRLVHSASEADAGVIRQDFELDHLDWNLDADFKASSIPIPERYTHEKDLERVFGIKNPKPDVVFGFNPGAFASSEKLLLAKYDPAYGLSKGIISPFLVVEWKSSRGSMEECKYQARRAGAAMVNARQALHAIAIPNEPKEEPDIANVVFSCTINTDLAHVHVHWCQLAASIGSQTGSGEMYYHMAVLTKYHLGDNADIARLRRGLHNIIDWNLSHRREALDQELRGLEALYEREAFTRETESRDDGRGSPASARKRRRTGDE